MCGDLSGLSTYFIASVLMLYRSWYRSLTLGTQSPWLKSFRDPGITHFSVEKFEQHMKQTHTNLNFTNTFDKDISSAITSVNKIEKGHKLRYIIRNLLYLFKYKHVHRTTACQDFPTLAWIFAWALELQDFVSLKAGLLF